MAAPSSSSSSSSSSFSSRFTYDVFLSFRGPDTRRGFVGHLFKALKDKGIHAFLDDKGLRGGQEITPSLLKAIAESRIAIVVLSKDYASSSFCLDELSYILECFNQKDRLVLPVFYYVDPSHVRRQIGTYGEAWAKQKERFKANAEKLEKWKSALRQVANLSGCHFKQHGDGYESEFIEKIVEEVSRKINRVPLHVANYPVGLEPQVLKVKSLLDVESDDGVLMVGIHGIGGIGKTTLAVAVYNSIADNFEGLCFLQNVRENANKHGLEHLQQILLCKILGVEKIELAKMREGISLIQCRLRRKKVLLILDDVDKGEQLEFLVGRSDRFGPGSRVIITTRNKQLLTNWGVDRTHEVEPLNEKDAFELLSWKAFKTDKVDPEFRDVINDAVAYASGLPLALDLIGSNLVGKSVAVWRSALKQYRRFPDKKIQQIFKVSFDALEDYEQEIFLDIACYFKGHRLAEVEDILCAHHSSDPQYGINVLVDKSLIKIDVGTVTLHDLIQDVGREIVRQESPAKPGECSRLWFHEDIVQVLQDSTGSEKIQILILDFPKSEEKVVEWDGEAFKRMKRLKTLIIRNGRFSQAPKHLPNSLIVLEWRGYAWPSFPSDFHLEELLILKIPCLLTSPRFPGIQKKLVNLTVLDFNNSECIKEIPDVSGLPNLQELSFARCENLIEIHESVGLLDKLRVLNADGCWKLRTFPPIKLASLETFNFSHCSSLESFPEILGKMENITSLFVFGTPIKKLPSSIQNLIRLRFLSLDGCGMPQLPNSIGMLSELFAFRVNYCGRSLLPKQDEGEEQLNSMECLDLSNHNISALAPNLKAFHLSGKNFKILPSCIKEFPFLMYLTLDGCKNLKEIKGIPPNLRALCARSCTSLEDLELTLFPARTKECLSLEVRLDGCKTLKGIREIPPNINLFAIDCISLTQLCRSELLDKELHEKAGNRTFILPGKTIPEWFMHRREGWTISFWPCNEFLVFSVCVVIEPLNHCILDRISAINLFINGNLVRNFGERASINVDHIVILDLQRKELGDVLLQNEWNRVMVCIDYDKCSEDKPIYTPVKQIGVHLFEQDGSMEDIQFSDPYKRGQSEERLSLLPPPIKSLNDNANWDSNSMALTRISRTTSLQGLQEQRHLTSIKQEDFEASESVNEATGEEQITLGSRNEEENNRSPLIELLQTTKEYEVTSERCQPYVSNDKSMTCDPMELECQMPYSEHQGTVRDKSCHVTGLDQRSGKWQLCLRDLFSSLVSLCCSFSSLDAP